MTTILNNNAARFAVTVQANGASVPIGADSTVTAQLFATDGVTQLSQAVACDSGATGADWPAGVVAVAFDAQTTGALPVGAAMLVLSSSDPALVKRFPIQVQAPTTIERSALFVKDFIVDELRADRLMLASSNFFSGDTLSDDYLWQKVLAAESEIAHTLRVPLAPTQFFPYPPTEQEIAALPAGMPYAVDPPYDYGPEFFQGDSWGYLATRQKPVQSIQLMQFAYPDPAAMIFVVPQDWIRLDQKYGVVRLVPATYAVSVPLSSFIMQAISAGRTIPFMLEVKYIAGISDARREYPELVDIIKKLAVLKAIEDAFPAQSGSISADGLSQSMSVDMSKYRETIDVTLNGEPGTNGGLMTAIHGIRVGVLG
ncbi:hypothetical protein [Paraburkholderia phenoliruptrix]|uniref:hypothetical protein n=1 Tax=Paraburkholderia phenoliruptrix TaxID=252970 RepID=UPI0034CE07E5